MGEWISVSERLPEIPKENFAVQVLATTFDSLYDSAGKRDGRDVSCFSYGPTKGPGSFEGTTKELDFREYWFGEHAELGPVGDPVTHWMYLPPPPERSEVLKVYKEIGGE